MRGRHSRGESQRHKPRRSQAATWLACSLGLFATAAAILATCFLALNAATFAQFLSTYSIGGAVLGASFATMGTLIAVRRPANAVGWLFLMVGLSQGVDALDTEYARYTLVTHPGSLPGGAWMDWLASWTWAPGLGFLPLALLLFPTGRPPSQRWGWFPWVVAVAIILLVVPVALVGWPLRGTLSWQATLPAQVAGPVVLALQRLGLALVGISMVAAACSLLLRFWRAQGEERQQLKWLAFAGILTTLFVAWLVLGGAPEFHGFTLLIGLILLFLVLPSIPVAAGIAILRYHLYDIDLIIRRTLLFSTLTLLLALVYFASVVLLQQIFGRLLGPQQNQVSIVVSTLTIAALFTPFRRYLQAAIDRRFYRRQYDAEKIMAAFSLTVRNETDLDQLTTRLVAVVEETLQPAQVSLWLRPAQEAGKGDQTVG